MGEQLHMRHACIGYMWSLDTRYSYSGVLLHQMFSFEIGTNKKILLCVCVILAGTVTINCNNLVQVGFLNNGNMHVHAALQLKHIETNFVEPNSYGAAITEYGMFPLL